MAGDPIPLDFRVKHCYTLEEAVNLMKMYDRYSITMQPIRWVSCKTGQPVSIGYND